jgi:CheY-like chemotaxis protein
MGKVKIGVVDDEATIVGPLKEMLSRKLPGLEHIDIEPCIFDFSKTNYSPEEIAKEGPDLLLADYHLGAGSDGISLARRVKELRPQMKLVLMSGIDAEERCRAFVKGNREHLFDDFLNKPFTRNELVYKINQNLFRPLNVSFLGSGTFAQMGAAYLGAADYVQTVKIYSRSGNFQRTSSFLQACGGKHKKISVTLSLEDALKTDIAFFCSDVHGEILATRTDRLDLIEKSGEHVLNYSVEIGEIVRKMPESPLIVMVTNPNGPLLHIMRRAGYLDPNQLTAMITNDIERFEAAYRSAGDRAQKLLTYLEQTHTIMGLHGGRLILVPKKVRESNPQRRIMDDVALSAADQASEIASNMPKEEIMAARDAGVPYTMTPIEFADALKPFAHFKRDVGTLYGWVPVSPDANEGRGYFASPVKAIYTLGGIRLKSDLHYIPEIAREAVKLERAFAEAKLQERKLQNERI